MLLRNHKTDLESIIYSISSIFLFKTILFLCFLGRLNRSVLAEEETFLDLLIFMKILTTILTKEYFDFTSGKIYSQLGYVFTRML